MELGLLIFALVMAGLAVAAVVYFLIAEMSEAWDISHQGWTRGHGHHRLGHHA